MKAAHTRARRVFYATLFLHLTYLESLGTFVKEYYDVVIEFYLIKIFTLFLYSSRKEKHMRHVL